MQRVVSDVQSYVAAHRRALGVGVSVVMAGFAATAFGIAPLAPDAADLPRRVVAETVLPLPLEPQLEVLAGHSFELWRSEITRPAETAASLLRRLNVTDPGAASFLRSDATARAIVEGRPGKMVSARTLQDGTLVELVARFPAASRDLARSHFTRITVQRGESGWQARTDVVPLQGQVRIGSGAVRSTLFAATDEAGLPDAVALQLVEIFSADIDFHHDVQRGDQFRVVYETLTADGEPIAWNQGTGRVVAAEFVRGDRVHQAVWFRDGQGREGYFGLDGRSKRGSVLGSPLAFSRMTSGFAMRMHPILQQMRAHRGVDYAAPTGTPVRVVADGVVDFAGWQNGYGNVVIVRHNQDRETVYAHLSRIDVKRGARLAQGQEIGAVGATGWATGPHLHFEFRVGGVHQDPTRIARTSEAVTVAAADRPAFEQRVQTVRVALEAARSMTTAAVSSD